MTTSRDLEHVLQRYLEDGPTELPDRSFDEVRASIDHIQQRVVIGPWRFPSMPVVARFAAIGVAVLVLSLAVINLGPGQHEVGIVPPPPSTEPSTGPSPTTVALPGQLDSSYSPKPIASGIYFVEDPRNTNVQRMTLTIPDGWSTSQGFLVKHQGEPGYVMLVPWVISHVYPDPCHRNDADVLSVGTTVDELLAVVAAQTGRTATAPADVNVSGFPGKTITLTQSSNIDVTTCTGGVLRYWPGAGPDFTSGLCCDPAGNIDDVYAVDANGHILVIVARHYPQSTGADVQELSDVFTSIQLVPLPAPALPSPGSSASPTS